MRVPSIAALARNWRVTWSPMSWGGILLLAAYDEDEAARISVDLAGSANVTVLNEQIVTELTAFFRDASLSDGRYAVPNYYAPQAPAGSILLDSFCDGRKTIAVPTGPVVDATFTGEHLRLIRAANVTIWESLVAAIDPQRPYGSARTRDEAIAQALGEIPRASESQRYDRLHGEMLFALHAFLLHGS
jgi:hypothetical protein